MNEQLITSKIQQLNSEPLKQELLFFLDYLLTKQNAKPTETSKKIPTFGSAKGTFKMADDFDEPLDDFADYMS
jgi:type I site-specific restriction endonuclease